MFLHVQSTTNIPTPILTLRYIYIRISRRLSNVRVLDDNQYELPVGCDHDLSVATSHPQHAQFVRGVQIPHEIGRPRRELRQHRRVLCRLLFRQSRLERCSCGSRDQKRVKRRARGEWFLPPKQGHKPKESVQRNSISSPHRRGASSQLSISLSSLTFSIHDDHPLHPLVTTYPCQRFFYLRCAVGSCCCHGCCCGCCPPVRVDLYRSGSALPLRFGRFRFSPA